MSQNKNVGGRPKLPRDKSGKIIGKNYKMKSKPFKSGAQAPAKSKPAVSTSPDEDFLSASDSIQAETNEALKTQAPEVEVIQPGKTDQGVISQAAPGAVQPVVDTMDWAPIISPVLDGLGAIAAAKLEDKEMMLTSDENLKLSKAYSDLLNVMFPDLEALTLKEKAIVVAGMTTLSVIQAKAMIYHDNQKNKLEAAKAKAAEVKAA